MRAAIALTALLLLAACGDGGDPKPPPAEQLTHVEYVQRADAVCAKADEALAALPQPAGVADVAAYAQQAADIVAAQRDGLEALRPPADDATQAVALGAALDAVVQVARDLVEVSRGGDAATIRAYVERNRTADDEADRLAQAIGMRVCGAPGP